MNPPRGGEASRYPQSCPIAYMAQGLSRTRPAVPAQGQGALGAALRTCAAARPGRHHSRYLWVQISVFGVLNFCRGRMMLDTAWGQQVMGNSALLQASPSPRHSTLRCCPRGRDPGQHLSVTCQRRRRSPARRPGGWGSCGGSAELPAGHPGAAPQAGPGVTSPRGPAASRPTARGPIAAGPRADSPPRPAGPGQGRSPRRDPAPGAAAGAPRTAGTREPRDGVFWARPGWSETPRERRRAPATSRSDGTGSDAAAGRAGPALPAASFSQAPCPGDSSSAAPRRGSTACPRRAPRPDRARVWGSRRVSCVSSSP